MCNTPFNHGEVQSRSVFTPNAVRRVVCYLGKKKSIHKLTTRNYLTNLMLKRLSTS